MISSSQLLAFNKFLTELNTKQVEINDKLEELTKSLLNMEKNISKFQSYLKELNDKETWEM